MTKISLTVTALLGLLVAGRAQTNVIAWQTNWPADGWTNTANYVNQQLLPDTTSWFTGTKGSVTGFSNSLSTNLLMTVSASSSLTVYTYFAATNYNELTNLSSTPIQLSSNVTIRATVDFYVVGTAPQNSNRGLRFALLYAGANANVTGSGNGSNLGLEGYGQNMNFGTLFGEAPLQTFADTNGPSTGSQLASTGQFGQIEGNGGGTTNDPGFTDNVNYTLVFAVTENNPTNISISTTFLGSTFSNGASITQTVIDTNYCYTNFDEFVMRPGEGSETAGSFTITSFKIETYTNASTAVSSDATLSSLALLPAGALAPIFASNTLSYATTEAYGSTPTVTATSADPAATLQLIYNALTNALTSGGPSAPLTLNPNPGVTNVVDVRVTAADAVTVNDYLVNITQLPSQTRPTLVNSVSGSSLNLSWPLDHVGYRLLMQTNNLNLGVSGNLNDWGTVAGSTATNTAAITITKTNHDEFYRLIYP